ncbi:MAG: hypothetical protein ABGZ35_22520, partial [Planctomycetaceae bacterium]
KRKLLSLCMSPKMRVGPACRAWLRNLDAGRENLQPLLGEVYGEQHAVRWLHRWRLFFMACEELFAFNGGNEWFVSHYLFERCPHN